MNNATAPVQSVKGIKFFDGVKSLMTKITSAFKPKKKPEFSNATALEAIQFVEWRTKYDYQRIVQYVYTASLQKENPDLYAVLKMNLPVKDISWRTIETAHRLNWPQLSNRTREILLDKFDWRNQRANVQIADSSFERRLLQFFGNLNPKTKTLLNGGETKTQKELRTIASEKIFFNNISKTSQASYETRLLQEFALVLNAMQVAAIDEPAEEVEQPALLALPAAKEVVVEVVAETLPVKETTEQPIETVTLTEAEKLEKTIKGLKKLNLPDLKKFAKANNIQIKGRMTQITSIREKIIRELRKQVASES